MRKLAQYLLVPVSLMFLAPLAQGGSASAATSNSSFDLHVGDGFGPLVEPDVAATSDGATLTVRAIGVFDAGTKTASGSGTFVHRSADGSLVGSGTFSITGLTTFQFFGCGVIDGHPLPPNFCGGRVILPVHVVGTPAGGGTEEFDAVLTVTCDVGNPPPGQPEGIAFNVPDVINFNKSVSGGSVYVEH